MIIYKCLSLPKYKRIYIYTYFVYVYDQICVYMYV